MMFGVVLTIGVAGLAWAWQTRPEQRRAVIAIVAATGLGFQVLHALEHLLQMGAWAAAPGRSPFVTPWAVAGRDVLAVGGNIAIGDELLHLSGNLVFLAGVVALAVLAGRTGLAGNRSLRLAVVIQGVHVLEHIALTVTAATVGKAIGVTSAFGLLEPGPLLWTLRPMGHFVLNGVATAFAIHATLHYVRATRIGELQPAHS